MTVHNTSSVFRPWNVNVMSRSLRRKPNPLQDDPKRLKLASVIIKTIKLNIRCAEKTFISTLACTNKNQSQRYECF